MPKNPYKNTANSLVNKKVGNTQEFINNNIKNTQLNITLGEIIEYVKWTAFNEGVAAGKYEFSQDLKRLMDVEKPRTEEDEND